MQWVQVLIKEKMTLHYNVTNKHRQTRQHLPFVHTVYKNTSAVINALIILVKLQMSENKSSPTKTSILQQFLKEIAKHISRLPISFTPTNDRLLCSFTFKNDRPLSSFIPFYYLEWTNKSILNQNSW